MRESRVVLPVAKNGPDLMDSECLLGEDCFIEDLLKLIEFDALSFLALSIAQ